jgi:superfamily I DNA/RNA helicase
MIVLSVAGSGKTVVLTERIIRLIEEGFDPARLLAITFAKKAVPEIQSRLKKRLNGNGNKALVCTFHSLGYRILKRENSLGIGCRLVETLCRKLQGVFDLTRTFYLVWTARQPHSSLWACAR